MNFGILLFNDVEQLDFVGPREMLRMWSLYADGPKYCLLIAETRAPELCAKVMSVNPHSDLGACPPLDVLLVPGGQGTRQQVDNPVLVDFVVRQAAQCSTVMSVCTGAFVLHVAGLLAGRKATTHWGAPKRLRELGGVTVVEERHVRDGKVWSPAGVPAGVDMMLAHIANVAGDDAALVPVLLGLRGGTMAVFELEPGQTSAAVSHRSVEELWFVLSGSGEMWRRDAAGEAVVATEPCHCLSIPLGNDFQFRCLGHEPLCAVAATMPPWPGAREALAVPGHWPATRAEGQSECKCWNCMCCSRA